eukprot:5658697-Prymnesium_polylepis.1
MGELPRRAAIGEAHGDGRAVSRCALRLAQLAAATLAEPLQITRPELEAAAAISGLKSRWERSTLAATYLRLRRCEDSTRRQRTATGGGGAPRQRTTAR